jgi:hypothetical protein
MEGVVVLPTREGLVRVSPVSPTLVGGSGAAPHRSVPTPPAEPYRARSKGALGEVEHQDFAAVDAFDPNDVLL